MFRRLYYISLMEVKWVTPERRKVAYFFIPVSKRSMMMDKK